MRKIDCVHARIQKMLGAIVDQGGSPQGQKSKKNFLVLFKNDIFSGNFMRKIDCAHSRSVKTFVSPLKMKKIRIFRCENMGKNTYFSIFKGETKVFTLRECAQSIFRIKL